MKKILMLLVASMMGGVGYGQTMKDFERWPKGMVREVPARDTAHLSHWRRNEVDFLNHFEFRGKLSGLGNFYTVCSYQHAQWNKTLDFVNLKDDTGAVNFIEINDVFSSAGIFTRGCRFGWLSLRVDTIPYLSSSRNRPIFEFSIEKCKIDSITHWNDSIMQWEFIGSKVNNIKFQYCTIQHLEVYPLGTFLFRKLKRPNSVTYDPKIDTFSSNHSTYETFEFITKDTVAKMVFSEDKITAPLRLDSLHVHKLIFYHSSLAQLDISEITAGTLSLHLTHIDKPSKISGILTNRLNLEGIELGTGAELDLRGLRRDNFRDARHQRIPVSLLGAQIEKLHLDWKNCSADWSTDSSDEAKTRIYETLLENFKKHGQMDSRELADKEYSRYKTYHANFLGLGFFWDFFDRMWWDYGYGGWQVIVWTLFLPFLWALAMWVWGGYRRLNDEVYELENYPPKRAGEETRVYRKTYWESLVYVSTIFFALSIKFDNLNFERKRPLLLFLIIYLNGIFCLFFIVNFLLKA